MRILAAVLMLLIGLAIGAGGVQLWRGGAQVWPDVVTSEAVVRRSATVFLIFAVALLLLGLAITLRASWAVPATQIVLVLILVGATVGQQQLFGALRAVHIVTNFVLAALILGLLWVASSSGRL